MESVNWKLKHLIQSKFGTQTFFSRASGLTELRISKLIRHRAKATPDEMEIIAQKLGCEVSEIFPQD
jgi:uncharacterized protein YfkK (UPF0435 family)